MRKAGTRVISASICMTSLCVVSYAVNTFAAETCAIPKAKKHGYPTVQAALQKIEKPAHARLYAKFKETNTPYPPKKMIWVCYKAEKILDLYSQDGTGKYRKVLSYPIIGASGNAGPKLKEGDMQVPEGFYKLNGYRPHLAGYMGLDVDYPNVEDRRNARLEKRSNLGYDILIHGSRWSTGCLAMENEPIEEMFVLAHDVGFKNIELLFCPCDLTRSKADVDMSEQPSWLPALYQRLQSALLQLK